MSLKRYLDEKQQRKVKKPDPKKQDLSEEIIQYTDLEFAFVMNGSLLLYTDLLNCILLIIAPRRIVDKYLPGKRHVFHTYFNVPYSYRGLWKSVDDFQS